MEFKDLTAGQKAKIKPGMTAEELLNLAKTEGVELSTDDLDGVAGGWTDIVVCSRCRYSYDSMKLKKCPKCGCESSTPV